MNAIYLENKDADIKATKGDNDFFYAWKVKGKVLSVEYAPLNWPSVTVVITDENGFDIERKVEMLRDIGYEIEGDEEEQ